MAPPAVDSTKHTQARKVNKLPHTSSVQGKDWIDGTGCLCLQERVLTGQGTGGSCLNREDKEVSMRLAERGRRAGRRDVHPRTKRRLSQSMLGHHESEPADCDTRLKRRSGNRANEHRKWSSDSRLTLRSRERSGGSIGGRPRSGRGTCTGQTCFVSEYVPRPRSPLHRVLAQGTLVRVPATGLAPAGPPGLETSRTFSLSLEPVATSPSRFAGQPR